MFVVYYLMFQVTTAVEEANAALVELRVEHKEDLVVPFRIPWNIITKPNTKNCWCSECCLVSAAIFSRGCEGSSICDMNDYGQHLYLMYIYRISDWMKCCVFKLDETADTLCGCNVYHAVNDHEVWHLLSQKEVTFSLSLYQYM